MTVREPDPIGRTEGSPRAPAAHKDDEYFADEGDPRLHELPEVVH